MSIEKGIINFVKLTENAKIQSKSNSYSAGFDLFSAYDYEIPPSGKVLALTDLQIEVPEDCYGRIAPLFSLANKNSIHVGAGVIDRDYRGNIGVILFNFGKEVFKVNKGDRIAQFICHKIAYPCLMESKELSVEKNTLNFSKLTENAKMLTQGTSEAAGFDLCSAYDYVIPPSGKVLVLTDLQIHVPEDCYGRIAPRSGLTHKNFIDVGAGVLDPDYQGNIGVILFNFGKEVFKVNKGDRIAQLICEKLYKPFSKEKMSIEKGIINFVKLTENAKIQSKSNSYSAGFDLFSAYDYEIPPSGKVLALTDLQIEVPEDCYGRIAPLFSLANKNSIHVGAGVIDRDYRGNIGVILFNFGKEVFKVNKGDRIAQFICHKIAYPCLIERLSLNETVRGKDGFGSTGKN